MDNTHTTLSGQILIAMPNIGDARFERSVIYMESHDAQGAMGFVLNKPAESTVLRDILVKMPAAIGDSEAANMPVYIGGPVQSDYGHIIYVETDGTSKARTLATSKSLAVLVKAVQQNINPPMRLLLGYAGWSAGQLESELQDNVWLIAQCDPDDVLTVAPEQLYAHCVASLGFDLSALSHEGGTA